MRFAPYQSPRQDPLHSSPVHVQTPGRFANIAAAVLKHPFNVKPPHLTRLKHMCPRQGYTWGRKQDVRYLIRIHGFYKTIPCTGAHRDYSTGNVTVTRECDCASARLQFVQV